MQLKLREEMRKSVYGDDNIEVGSGWGSKEVWEEEKIKSREVGAS